MRHNIIMTCLFAALTIGQPVLAQGEQSPDMACLNPIQNAKLLEGRDSLIIGVSQDRTTVYELAMLQGRWILFFRAGADLTCIIAQGTQMHVSPNIRDYLPQK